MNAVLTSSKSTEHNTPLSVLAPVYDVLGPSVGLDPCSNAGSLVCADGLFDLRRGEDGLSLPWRPYRSAFVNPPYGGSAGLQWAKKINQEGMIQGIEIIALVPARVDTRAWQEVYFVGASAICFWRGRVRFLLGGKEQDPAPFPSALIYYGSQVDRFRRVFGPLGAVV